MTAKDHIPTKEYLTNALRSHLKINAKFSDEMIELNLLSFFVQDDDAAIKWVRFIEQKLDIDIPDMEVDAFFFSDLNHMNALLNKYVKMKADSCRDYVPPVFSKFSALEKHDVFCSDALNKEPLVFTSIMEEWQAYPKWNARFFEKHYGEHQVLADRFENGKSTFVQTTLKSFISYMRECEDLFPFYAKTSLHLSTAMRTEYDVEKYFPCWYRKWYDEYSNEERKLNLSNLYLGPKHARSPLHVDMWGTSFWNALFEGSKLWLFFSEQDEPYLYKGAVDPFDADLSRFPLVVNARPMAHIQQPGELIYCPGGIWHCVLLLEPCIALSENFINAENYQNVLSYFQKEGQQNAYEKMVRISHAYRQK